MGRIFAGKGRCLSVKLAFLYAGQGSQIPGMGRDLYEACPSVRPIFDLPENRLGFDLRHLCFEGTEEELSRTRYTQPCMVAFAGAVTRIFQESGIRPDYAAGLSLGEYSALSCAGVFTPEEAVEVAAFRGRVMEEAAAGHRCKMDALLGADRPLAEEVCQKARTETGKVAEVANLNCAGQVVIGGDAEAVDRAAELALSQGIKRAVPLRVSGAFHTSLMAPAGQALERYFHQVAFRPMELPVVFNTPARPLSRGEDVAGMLVRQVQSPTRFAESIQWMLEQGVDTVVEIGPGKVLSGFVKKSGQLAPGFQLFQAESLESIREILPQLKKGA